MDAKLSLYANIDPNLELRRDDGAALPEAVTLSYDPLRGFIPASQHVRIYSNDVDADIEVRLGHPVELVSDSGTRVPLTVSLNGTVLTVEAQNFNAEDLFDGGLPRASVSMPLTIKQATRGTTVEGRFEGSIGIMINQKAAAL
ncbi:CS1 type fimbrial major subunit [Streptomyces parvus]|uniref:CS1 type fimbrial major subunit n=1 Tax=Streptomyces parvus TaxID=66428 RepID=UPI0034403B41